MVCWCAYGARMVRIWCAQWCMLRAFDARATLRACGAAYGANRACIYDARMVCMWRAHGAHHVVHVARISCVYRTHMARNGEHLMCICRAYGARACGTHMARTRRACGAYGEHGVQMGCIWDMYGAHMVRTWRGQRVRVWCRCVCGVHMMRV